MAKMFYSLEEAAKKLGKTPNEVRDMAASGQLQEFKDRDRLVFKVEQVDLLAGGDDEAIGLAESGEAISLADSDPAGTGGESTKERSGISIFEADEMADTSDANAQTQVTSSVGGVRVPDAGGSGSGLLDLTRDSNDDTGIGAGLMSDIYNDKDGTGAGAAIAAPAAGGALFENSGVASDVGSSAAATPMMVYAEPIDGPGSGLVGGLALAMIVILGFAMVVALYGLVGFGGGLVGMLGGQGFLISLGAMAALALVCALVGWALGRRG